MKLGIYKNRKFTLVEVLVTCAVTGIILAALMPFMIFALTTQDRMRKQADMDQAAWIAREWIKHDTRATARDDILMWPAGTNNALAISFPVLRRDQEETSTPLDSDENIEWNQTIIYHLHYNSDAEQIELRRTVFNPRDNSLSKAQREKQLEDTFLSGNGSSTYNGENAYTATHLYNLKNFRIASELSELDCYNATRSRTHHSMGTWVLGPGYHDFKFTCTGKNSDATGFNLGLDTLDVSATNTVYDVESLLPADNSTGAVPELESMDNYTGWQNNAQFLFPATGSDDSVTLRIHNDMWLESSFNFEGADLAQSKATFDSDIGENVCQLDGNSTAWEAEVQTLGGSVDSSSDDHTNATVRTIIAGEDPVIGGHIAEGGRLGQLRFRAAPGSALTIESAYIMERDNGYNGDDSTKVKLSFSEDAESSDVDVFNDGDSIELQNGATITSEKFDLAIDKEKDYLVSFHISDDGNEAAPAIWEDSTGSTHSHKITGDENDVSDIADWDSLTDTSVSSHPVAVAAESLYVTYPESGVYTSRIIDTKLADPEYSRVTWQAQTPSDTGIEMLVRAGDEEDLSDAVDWDSALSFDDPEASNSLSAMTTGRYVQWRAILYSNDSYTVTPKLRYVNVLWPGRKRGIDVGLAVEEAPDMGILKLAIDDKGPSPATLRMSFTTAREIHGGEIRKSFAIDAKPRNN
ncbi:MAG: PulJ/GspJ family protein [Verrucomicrobiota bacterium]